MDLMEARRRLLMTENTIVPAKYMQVECIQNSGTAFIDTGIPITSDLEMYIVFRCLETAQGSGRYLMGEYVSNNGEFYLYVFNKNYYQTAFGCAYSNTSVKVDTEKHTAHYAIRDGYSQVYIDGTAGWSDNGKAIVSTMPSRSIKVAGTRHNGIIPVNTYSVILNKAGVTIRNFIPCVRKSDNKPGMYDTVTKTFFTNAGTGEFIVPN